MSRAKRSPIAALRRELATRDAFLARVSVGLDARIEALGACSCEGVEALRGFARELAIIAGREEARAPRRAPLDAGEYVEACIRRLRAQRPEVASKAPELRLTRAGDLSGAFDAEHLETMLLELLTNAYKYGGGRPVGLRLEGRGEWVRIVVEDEGPGLDRAAQVGRRFVRGPGSTKAPGFGVGVWLTRVIAAANGGTLRLSRRPGGGTRAVVTLPRSGPAGS
ncbi:MAG: HAMP domain-containing histidine kinase [Polyangiaceae bacterium]|nr:HAMP domain-containing histidine kinase [Polyangiaceae bacterium]